MTIIYLALGVIFIGIGIGLSKAFYAQIFSPISAYALPFGFAFLLMTLPIINYRPLSPGTLLALFLPLLALICGAFLGGIVSGRQKSGIISDTGPRLLANKVRRILLLTYLFASAGLLLQFYYMARSFGGISAIVMQPTVIYHTRVLYGFDFPSWVGYLVSLSYCGMYLAGSYTALAGWRNWYSIWTVLIVVGVALSSMGRASILWAGLLIFNGNYLTHLVLGKAPKLRISVRKLITYLILISLIIGATIYIRLIRAQDNFESTQTRIGYAVNPVFLQNDSTLLRGIIHTYLNFTGPIPVLGERIDYPDPQLGYGVKTFNALFRMVIPTVGRYGPIRESSVLPGFNVFTAIGDWFYDFGWIGILFIPFVMGVLSSWLFYKAIRRSIGFWQMGLLAFSLLWLEWAIFFSMTYQGFFFIGLAWLLVVSHGVKYLRIPIRRQHSVRLRHSHLYSIPLTMQK